MQSQVRFNRVPEKVPEKVPGGFGAKPSQVQQCSEEGPGEALVQRQVRFSRVPEKVEPGRVPQGSGEGSGEGSGKGLGGVGGEPGQVQQVLRPFYTRKPS